MLDKLQVQKCSIDKLIFRSSHPELFYKKGVLKTVKFRGNNLRLTQLATFLKKRLRCRRFLVNFANFLRKTYYRTPIIEFLSRVFIFRLCSEYLQIFKNSYTKIGFIVLYYRKFCDFNYLIGQKNVGPKWRIFSQVTKIWTNENLRPTKI